MAEYNIINPEETLDNLLVGGEHGPNRFYSSETRALCIRARLSCLLSCHYEIVHVKGYVRGSGQKNPYTLHASTQTTSEHLFAHSTATIAGITNCIHNYIPWMYYHNLI
jgi:hypothetical protein